MKGRATLLLHPIALAVLLLGFLVSGAIVASAQGPNISFPVAELGGCASEEDCRAYCDDPAHFSACLAFAEAHGLLSDEELEHSKRTNDIIAGGAGPGGCTSEAECTAYCSNLTNIEDCLAFAEEHDVVSDEELAEMRQVAAALRSGVALPGGCTSEDECKAYCSDIAHISECLAFAEQAGFLSGEELEEARKVAAAVEAGAAPPGGCSSKEECEAYCEDETHIEECFAFAEAAGFVTEEEAELFRKTGGRGPGGCRGEEECEAYCNNPNNREECFAFAKEHGLIPEEELDQAREGIERLQRELDRAPGEVIGCLDEAVGAETVDQIVSGELLPRPEIGMHVRECFESFFGERAEQEFQEGVREYEGYGEQYPEEARDRPSAGVPGDVGGAVPFSVEDCFVELFGADYKEQLFRGELDPQVAEAEVRRCVEERTRDGFDRDFGGGFEEGHQEFKELKDGSFPEEDFREGFSEEEFIEDDRVYEEEGGTEGGSVGDTQDSSSFAAQRFLANVLTLFGLLQF